MIISPRRTWREVALAEQGHAGLREASVGLGS